MNQAKNADKKSKLLIITLTSTETSCQAGNNDYSLCAPMNKWLIFFVDSNVSCCPFWQNIHECKMYGINQNFCFLSFDI